MTADDIAAAFVEGGAKGFQAAGGAMTAGKATIGGVEYDVTADGGKLTFSTTNDVTSIPAAVEIKDPDATEVAAVADKYVSGAIGWNAGTTGSTAANSSAVVNFKYDDGSTGGTAVNFLAETSAEKTAENLLAALQADTELKKNFTITGDKDGISFEAKTAGAGKATVTGFTLGGTGNGTNECQATIGGKDNTNSVTGADAHTPDSNVTGDYNVSTTDISMWTAGAVVSFVYDGTYWVMEGGTTATTSCYGMTRLSDAVDSTSTALAATPSAVKKAYNLAKSAKDTAENHTHSAGEVTLTDETAALLWPDEGTRPEDPTVDGALSVLQEEAGAVGTIKSTVRTDLGDDWLLCNGEPVPPEYPELIAQLGGVKLDGIWNYKEDFAPGASNDYFVVNNKIFTIHSISKSFYLYQIKSDGTIKKTLLRDFSNLSAAYTVESWAYYGGKIYLMMSTSASYSGSFNIAYATFDGETVGTWTTKSGNSSTTFFGQSSNTNGWVVKICGSKSGIYISGYYGSTVQLRFCTDIDGPYTSLTVSIGITVSSSINKYITVTNSWFYDITSVRITISGAENEARYLYRGTTVAYSNTNCNNFYYTVFNNRLYAKYNDVSASKYYIVSKLINSTASPVTISSGTSITLPGDFFKYKGQWYRVNGKNKLTAVDTSTTSPYYQDLSDIVIEQDSTAAALAPGGAFLDCGDFIVAGPFSKFCIVPTISISGYAYTYMKGR